MQAQHTNLQSPQLTRGLSALVLDGVFSQALGVLTGGALLTGCALACGASPSFIGILAAIPFFAQLAQIPAVALIETIRRRRAICVTVTILARLMLLPLVLVPLIPDPGLARALLLGAFAVLTPLGAIGGCAWTSWTCDLVPRHRLGEIFGRRQFRANISGIAAGLLGGLIIDGWARLSPAWGGGGYVGVFALAVGAAVMSTWYLTRMPDIAMPPRREGAIGKLFLKPFADTNFRRVMGFLGAWNLAVNLALPFFTVYVVKDLHCGITTAIALGIVSQLANIAALPFWGRASDRCSNKTVIACCAPIFLLCLFGWAAAGQPAPHLLTLPILFVLQVVLGAATAGLDLAGGNIALKLAPRADVTAYLGTNGVVKALCAGLAPVAGGFLADRLSGLSCSFVLPWGDLTKGGAVNVIEFQPWHIFFIAAGLLGCFALTRLRRIEEAGASDPAALAALLRELLGEKRTAFAAWWRWLRAAAPIAEKA